MGSLLPPHVPDKNETIAQTAHWRAKQHTRGKTRSWSLGLISALWLVQAMSNPRATPDLPALTAITAGFNHFLALGRDGTVWVWADDHSGAPQGSKQAQAIPTRVRPLADIVAIAAGYDHFLALRRDGTVWAWGDNHRQSQWRAWRWLCCDKDGSCQGGGLTPHKGHLGQQRPFPGAGPGWHGVGLGRQS